MSEDHHLRTVINATHGAIEDVDVDDNIALPVSLARTLVSAATEVLHRDERGTDWYVFARETGDPELDTMSRAYKLISDLDHDERRRVVDWLSARTDSEVQP